jgi:hypothetical protein
MMERPDLVFYKEHQGSHERCQEDNDIGAETNVEIIRGTHIQATEKDTSQPLLEKDTQQKETQKDTQKLNPVQSNQKCADWIVLCASRFDSESERLWEQLKRDCGASTCWMLVNSEIPETIQRGKTPSQLLTIQMQTHILFFDNAQCKAENPVHLPGTSLETMLILWWKRMHQFYLQHSLPFPKHRYVWMVQDTIGQTPTTCQWKEFFDYFESKHDHDFLGAHLHMLPMMKIAAPYWNCSKGIMRFSHKFMQWLNKNISKQKESSDGRIYFATTCAAAGFKMGSLTQIAPHSFATILKDI